MWAPLVENHEADGDGADYFVNKNIDQLFNQSADIDTIILGCTHYPILLPKIRKAVGDRARIIAQGDIVADSLADYLRRHPEIESRCSKGGECRYLTTENPDKFTDLARIFLNEEIDVSHIDISNSN